MGERLVGRSHECDHPPWVRRLPALTAPKFALDGTSYEIHARVRALVQEGLSVYRVDAERLRALEPDLILTQTQCEVCAVSERDVEAALATWLGRRPRIVSLKPGKLEDVWDDIERAAVALEVARRGAELVARMRDRVREIAARSAGAPQRPRVACLEWIEPPMLAGHWMPQLVELAGGRSLVAEAGRPALQVDWESLRREDPDLIVVMPCGFDLARTRREVTRLSGLESWEGLRAVCQGRVALADGNAYFNRPGPRLVESLEILAEIFHPERFHFGHRGCGWTWLADDR